MRITAHFEFMSSSRRAYRNQQPLTGCLRRCRGGDTTRETRSIGRVAYGSRGKFLRPASLARPDDCTHLTNTARTVSHRRKLGLRRTLVRHRCPREHCDHSFPVVGLSIRLAIEARIANVCGKIWSGERIRTSDPSVPNLGPTIESPSPEGEGFQRHVVRNHMVARTSAIPTESAEAASPLYSCLNAIRGSMRMARRAGR
jgi:hypothetical protein